MYVIRDATNARNFRVEDASCEEGKELSHDRRPNTCMSMCLFLFVCVRVCVCQRHGATRRMSYFMCCVGAFMCVCMWVLTQFESDVFAQGH